MPRRSRSVPGARGEPADVLCVEAEVRFDGRVRRQAAQGVGEENARLKRLLAEWDLEIDVVKEFLQKE